MFHQFYPALKYTCKVDGGNFVGYNGLKFFGWAYIDPLLRFLKTHMDEDIYPNWLNLNAFVKIYLLVLQTEI